MSALRPSQSLYGKGVVLGVLFIIPFILMYTAWSYYVSEGRSGPERATIEHSLASPRLVRAHLDSECPRPRRCRTGVARAYERGKNEVISGKIKRH